MKIVIRALVLGLCAAGASAAVASSPSAKPVVATSHPISSPALPMPNCNPSGCQN